jgi:hypothetical protein
VGVVFNGGDGEALSQDTIFRSVLPAGLSGLVTIGGLGRVVGVGSSGTPELQTALRLSLTADARVMDHALAAMLLESVGQELAGLPGQALRSAML